MERISITELSHCEGLNLYPFPKQYVIETGPYSPVENKNDLELYFKVFFFTDSCCSDIVHDESN